MKTRVFSGYKLDEYWTEIAQNIAEKMENKYKLDLPNIDYYFISLDEMASIKATHGWIVFPHSWEEGQSYYLNKMIQKLYGESVFEIVVNSYDEIRNTSVTAYINKSISDSAKKLVIAHVLGHAYLFKHNNIEKKFEVNDPESFLYRLSQKINRYEYLYGIEEVQDFIETIKHLSTLIDFYPPIEVKDESKKERKKIIEKILTKEMFKKKIPEKNEYDILGFLANYAPLEDWQKDLLLDYRELFYFLYSRARIKILHEGFSSLIELLYFLESTEEELPLKEWIPYSRLMVSLRREVPIGSSTIKEGFDPYFLGYYLLLYGLIKLTFKEYGEIPKKKWYERIRREDFIDIIEKPEFLEAWEEVLEKVKAYDDFLLIKELFDEEFFNSIARKYYFVYEGENYPWNKKIVVSRSYEDVYKTFLFSSFNMKLPRVYIPEDGGMYNKKENEKLGELLLIQDTSFPESLGISKQQLTLDERKEKEVLKALFKIWKKPVNLKTFRVEFEYTPLDPFDPSSLEEANGKIKEIIDRYDGESFKTINV
ncbi:MAG: SpoVR family protein [Candidatus Aenigmatarchaeota archaeon]